MKMFLSLHPIKGIKIIGICYLVLEQFLTWTAARDTCRREGNDAVRSQVATQEHQTDCRAARMPTSVLYVLKADTIHDKPGGHEGAVPCQVGLATSGTTMADGTKVPITIPGNHLWADDNVWRGRGVQEHNDPSDPQVGAALQATRAHDDLQSGAQALGAPEGIHNHDRMRWKSSFFRAR